MSKLQRSSETVMALRLARSLSGSGSSSGRGIAALPISTGTTATPLRSATEISRLT